MPTSRAAAAVAAATLVAVAAVATADKLYFASHEGYDVGYFDPSGDPPTAVAYLDLLKLKKADLPTGVAVDAAAGKVFWGNDDPNAASSGISSGDLGNLASSIKTIVDWSSGAVKDPEGMDLDKVNKIVYYADQGKRAIYSVPYAGGTPTVVHQFGGSSAPFDVAVDHDMGGGTLGVFAAVPGVTDGHFSSNGQIVLIVGGRLTPLVSSMAYPYAVCLHRAKKLLFYVSGEKGAGAFCFHYGARGTPGCPKSSWSVPRYVMDCEVDEAAGHIYYTMPANSTAGSIFRTALDGTDHVELQSTLNKPFRLSLA
uniref:Uncharacterized protein n=1 Tax=Bicosoecida sp. CB-2014 TaxID=1486930 RepID=A0A7S1GB28_9STRA|mmetsp:Transcript_27688/g.95795  ORF Transcript_27688/g.95795 Transcript_27688/m.95795 type:complete len:311 (+) Transcript_27688:130-1062(+)